MPIPEPHISEGVNVEARNEFLCTSEPGQGRTCCSKDGDYPRHSAIAG